MRTIRVSGRSVSLEQLLDLCRDVEHIVSPDAAPPVYVIVNERPLGPVRGGVWELVRERLEQGAESPIVFDSIVPEDLDTVPPPPAYDGVVEGSQRRGYPPRPSGARPRARPMRVLVAEHRDAYRARLIVAFCARAFEAVGVRDARQALTELAAHPPDVLVVEFELPDLAGDHLLVLARARGGGAPTTRILIASELPQILVPDCPAADAILGQPFDEMDLVAVAVTLLASRQEGPVETG